MIDLKVAGYDQITWHGDSYTIASTFGSVPIILFQTIPQETYGFIEVCIERIIVHETIHIILNGWFEKSPELDSIHGVLGFKRFKKSRSKMRE